MFFLKFAGIAKAVLEYAPIAIEMVERILGAGRGPDKRVAAAKETVEFLLEAIENGDFDLYGSLEGVDPELLFKAAQDEEAFVEKIAAVNDAVINLVNFVNSKAEASS